MEGGRRRGEGREGGRRRREGGRIRRGEGGREEKEGGREVGRGREGLLDTNTDCPIDLVFKKVREGAEIAPSNTKVGV